MSWDLEEALEYYKKQGAPADQSALVSLLREVQQESGGSVPLSAVNTTAAYYGVKPALLLAIIKRIPGLRLGDTHVLEVCAGPNCGKHRTLAALAEQLGQKNPKITVKFMPCMRMCGKGPNIKWNGTLHHRADEALLRSLTEKREP